MAEIVEAEIQSQPGNTEFMRIKQAINNFPMCLPGSDGKSLSKIAQESYAQILTNESFDPNWRFIDFFREDIAEQSEEAVAERLRESGISDKKIFTTFTQVDQDIQTALD